MYVGGAIFLRLRQRGTKEGDLLSSMASEGTCHIYLIWAGRKRTHSSQPFVLEFGTTQWIGSLGMVLCGLRGNGEQEARDTTRKLEVLSASMY